MESKKDMKIVCDRKLHHDLKAEAKARGLSLNQLVVIRLAQEIANGDMDAFEHLFCGKGPEECQ